MASHFRLISIVALASLTCGGSQLHAADPMSADPVQLRRQYLDTAKDRGRGAMSSTQALVSEIEKVAASRPSTKIVGGSPVPAGVFKETVAIRAAAQHSGPWLCSGVLIADDAVLTAAHCVCDLGLSNVNPDAQGPAKIFMTNTPFRPAPDEAADMGHIIISATLYNPDYCQRRSVGTDIALLRIEKNLLVPVPPGPIVVEGKRQFVAARIIPTFAYLSQAVQGMLIVGYGINDQGQAGQKIFANVFIASRICGTRYARALFGCGAGTEAVLAGDYGQDTCRGDSGGPAFAVLGNEYYLAGITSRAIDSSGRCGPGGIYTLVTPALVNWIKRQGVLVNAMQ